MQDAGVLPSIYLYSGMNTDKYGRGYDTLVNFEGKKIEIFKQNQFKSKLPNNKVPQIIFPSIRLEDSIEPIRFAYKDDSDFVEMWKDFPKIREKNIGDLSNEIVEFESDNTFQVEESVG
ncbi:hypothetical protein D3C73_1066710 [compost metagenome]